MHRQRCHVGIVASLAPATGNYAMALRLQRTFGVLGHQCTLFDVRNPQLDAELVNAAKQDNIVAFIGIHLLRSGWPLAQQPLPFALVMGGTDVNEHSLRAESRARMTRAVAAARAIVAMHPALAIRFSKIWPDHAKKLSIIPASLSLLVAPRLPPSSFPSYSLHAALGLPRQARIFLLPTNLRPVKDPLFLVSAFEQWHAADNDIHLAIVGPVLDASFADIVQAEIAQCKGVHYLDPIPALAMQEAMQQCFAVVNSSRSEGLSTAIMEAMAIGAPVIARSNTGNMSLLKHKETGLLFDTPEKCVLHAKWLIAHPADMKAVVKRAQKWIFEKYDPSVERKAYDTLLQRLTTQKQAKAKL